MTTYRVDYVIKEEDHMLIDIDPNLDAKEAQEFARNEICESMFVHADNLTVTGIKEVV